MQQTPDWNAMAGVTAVLPTRKQQAILRRIMTDFQDLPHVGRVVLALYIAAFMKKEIQG